MTSPLAQIREQTNLEQVSLEQSGLEQVSLEVRFDLPSGRLNLRVEPGGRDWSELLDLAVRQNPKRGFLFVSKVLGKHIPVSPRIVRETHTALAAGLPNDLRKNTLFIGLAETATALGQGVFDAYRERTGQRDSGHQNPSRDDLHFRHTTRYKIHGQTGDLIFQEPHSHATEHRLFGIRDLEAVQDVVLIDDEISTGTTLLNLSAALKSELPLLERVILVCLTDWSMGNNHDQSRFAELGLRVERVSLLRGAFDFQTNPDWKISSMPNVLPNPNNAGETLPLRSARTGASGFDEKRLADYLEHCVSSLPEHARVLVLGMGEYQYAPFKFAAMLEGKRSDLEVKFSATTRSPIEPGLAILYKLEFIDHCGDGIPNYVYNVDPKEFDAILVCFEGDCQPHETLLRTLGTRVHTLRLL
jgi:Phosphoribosyl transferase/TRSP domain C terminus to PRTase_2